MMIMHFHRFGPDSDHNQRRSTTMVSFVMINTLINISPPSQNFISELFDIEYEERNSI